MADLLPLLFPQAGLDLSGAFGLQRPGTTREGANVRAYEPSRRRNRGGSRPGMTRWLDEALPGEVQHLNLIVSTSAEAMPDVACGFGPGEDERDETCDHSAYFIEELYNPCFIPPPCREDRDPRDFRMVTDPVTGRQIRDGGWGLQPSFVHDETGEFHGITPTLTWETPPDISVGDPVTIIHYNITPTVP